jgi:hypothetical protein
MNGNISQKNDDKPEMYSYLYLSGRIMLLLPGISLGIPILISIVCDIPCYAIMALVGSAFLIEYGAVIPGIALGIGFYPIIAVISSVALSVILTSFELLDLLAKKFQKIEDFLERVERGRITGFISQYGIWGLVPGIMLLGFYVCPAVSWIFTWKRCHSVILMMAGYVAAAIAVYLFTTGVIAVFF